MAFWQNLALLGLAHDGGEQVQSADPVMVASAVTCRNDASFPIYTANRTFCFINIASTRSQNSLRNI
jgi:hypothetical protein